MVPTGEIASAVKPWALSWLTIESAKMSMAASQKNVSPTATATEAGSTSTTANGAAEHVTEPQFVALNSGTSLILNGTALAEVSPEQTRLIFAAAAHTKAVSVGVAVSVAVSAGVLVGVSVGVPVAVSVAVAVKVKVSVGVDVGVSVKIVSVIVAVAVAVGEDVSVTVAVNVGVAVSSEVLVTVSVGVGVAGHSASTPMIPKPVVRLLNVVSVKELSFPEMPSPRFPRPQTSIGQASTPVQGSPASSVHTQKWNGALF